jgi:hypothetical protein
MEEPPMMTETPEAAIWAIIWINTCKKSHRRNEDDAHHLEVSLLPGRKVEHLLCVLD